MDIDVYSEIKREDHPFYQKGSIHCFSFVTKEGRNFYGDVLLTIGQLYKFHIKTNHPFYIGTKESGSLSDDAYGALKIQGNFGTNEGGTLFFRPTEENMKEKEIYYQCTKHLYMGGQFLLVKPSEKINLVDFAEGQNNITDACFRGGITYYCQEESKVFQKESIEDIPKLIYASPKGRHLLRIDVSPIKNILWTLESDNTDKRLYLCLKGKPKFGITTKDRIEKDGTSLAFYSEEILFFSYKSTFYRLEITKSNKIIVPTDNPFYCQPDKNHWIYSKSLNKPNSPSWKGDKAIITDGIDILELLPEFCESFYSYSWAIGTKIVGGFFANGIDEKFYFADEMGRIFSLSSNEENEIFFVAPPEIFFQKFFKGEDGNDFILSRRGNIFIIQNNIFSSAKIVTKINEMIDKQNHEKEFQNSLRLARNTRGNGQLTRLLNRNARQRQQQRNITPIQTRRN